MHCILYDSYNVNEVLRRSGWETLQSSPSVTVVTADWISAVWACSGLQGYAVAGSVLCYVCVCVSVKGLGACSCSYFCMHLLLQTYLLSVCVHQSVCLYVPGSGGIWHTHVLGRTHWLCGVCPEQDSPHVSIFICLQITLLYASDTRLPIETSVIYRSNTDPCWRRWHSVRYWKCMLLYCRCV